MARRVGRLAGAARLGLALLLAAAPGQPAWAAFINYQGQLKTPAGQPASGSKPMTFELYTNAAGTGTPAWSETYASVPVDNGLFSVQLGSQNPWDPSLFNSDVWLKVTVAEAPSGFR